MNINFNVVTPLARFENVQKLIDMLRPHNINWHVITDEDNPKSHSLIFNEDWIHHYICPNNEVVFWNRCNHAMNWFLDNILIEDNTMYSFLNDDDAYEPDYFNRMSEIIKGDTENRKIIITSMKRGIKTPKEAIWERQHPSSTIYAVPENLQVGKIGLEQITVRGDILKQGYRFPLDQCGDGMFICNIVNNNYVILAAELYVLFNYFEPGRWVI